MSKRLYVPKVRDEKQETFNFYVGLVAALGALIGAFLWDETAGWMVFGILIGIYIGWAIWGSKVAKLEEEKEMLILGEISYEVAKPKDNT